MSIAKFFLRCAQGNLDLRIEAVRAGETGSPPPCVRVSGAPGKRRDLTLPEIEQAERDGVADHLLADAVREVLS